MILDNSISQFIVNQSQKANGSLGRVFEKLSTGKKINRASDDAALLSVARELEKQARGFKQVDRGLQDGMAAMQIADGGSSQISEMMQRQRELALAASNGTLNDSNRQALDAEYQALTAEIGRIAESTQFNGQALLNSQSQLSDGTGTLVAGAEGTVPLSLPNQDVRPGTLGLSGTSIATAAQAGQALSSLDQAMQTVNQQRTESGALYNRMDYAANHASRQEILMTDALSRAEDLDYAQAVTDRARNSLLQESALSALNNFNQIARNNVLGLLQ